MNNLEAAVRYILIDNIPLLQEKVNKINERLQTSGAPLIQMTVEDPAVTTASEHGFSGVRMTTSKVTISREVVSSLGRVRLLGKSDIDPTSNFMTHTFFTQINDTQRNAFEHPKHICHCDHCGTQRKRSSVFVFETDAGIFRVGSGCADEFAGLQIKRWSLAVADVTRELDQMSLITLSEARAHSVFPVQAFLKEAVLTIDTMGYFSARDYGVNSSGHISFESITAKADEHGDVHFEYPEEVIKRTNDITQYILTSEYRPEDKNNDYFVNLRNLVNFGYMTQRQAGKLAGAVRGYDRHMERLAQTEKYKEFGKNFLGTVGEKDIFKNLKVESSYFNEGKWGMTTKIQFSDESSNIITWNRTGYHEVERGQVMNLVGKIEAHNTFHSTKYQKDVKETRLTRCKILSNDEVLELEQKEAKKASRAQKKVSGLDVSPGP